MELMDLNVVGGLATAGFFVVYCVLCLFALGWAAEEAVAWWLGNRDRQIKQHLSDLLAELSNLSWIAFATLLGLSAGVTCGVCVTFGVIRWLGSVGTICVAFFIDGLVTVRDEHI